MSNGRAQKRRLQRSRVTKGPTVEELAWIIQYEAHLDPETGRCPECDCDGEDPIHHQALPLGES